MEPQILYGRRACRAVFERRAHDIRRIYYHRDLAKELSGILAWAASRRVIYRELDEAGLRKVAHGAHHEGLVLATEPLCYLPLEGDAPVAALSDPSAAGGIGSVIESTGRWMAVDRVVNPHNLGAILRTCAFLGVEALLAGGLGPGEKVNAAAIRVAEGGAEAVRLYAVPEPAAALAEFVRYGFAVVGLEPGGQPLRAGEFAGRPWILVAGHEQEGLAGATRAACTNLRGIAGDGMDAVGSLNVSVAVGIALATLTGAASPPTGQRPESRAAPAGGGRAGGRQPRRPAPDPSRAPRRKARPGDSPVSTARPPKKPRTAKATGKEARKGKRPTAKKRR